MQQLQKQPCCHTCAFTAGIVGALALVALLAAAFIFYKRSKDAKDEGAAGIATAPRRGPRAPEAAAAARQRHTPCQAPTLPARLAPTCLPSPSCSLPCKPTTPAPAATAHTVGAYEPGWSPEQMLSDMRAVEAAAEGLVAALRSSPDARGGPRRAAGLCRRCLLTTS
jgi:hypothetical protein